MASGLLAHPSGLNSTILFLHIPKTAGSTLNKIIDHQFKRAAVFTRHPTYPFNEEFKKLPVSQREKIKVLKGHMFFGLHEFLPQPYTYLTILREPVDRIISYYFHVLRHPDDYKEVTSRRMSLEEFVSSGLIVDLENGQTKLLAGVEGESATGNLGECTNAILEKAKINLEKHFSIVGLSERFDETLILIKRIFGWRNIFYIKVGVAKDRLKKESMPKETLDIIKKYNAFDIELYKYAEEKLDEQIRRQGPSFERELKEFRSLNKIYGKVYGSIYEFLRPFTRGVRHWLKTKPIGDIE